MDQFQKMDGTALLTPAQKRWVELERMVKRMSPYLPIPQPPGRFRQLCFGIATSWQLESAITGIILVNTVFMASFHVDQPAAWADTLVTANYVFLAIFSVEAALKITAFGRRYFADSMNLFDFVIVAGGVLSAAIPGSVSIGAQAARVFRVFRIFRFASRSRGVRSLFRTLYLSLPSIANLLLLLTLVIFIFAVVGNHVRAARARERTLLGFIPRTIRPQLFGGTKFGAFLNNAASFRHVGWSMLTMFQLLAGDDWSQIMRDCQVARPFCTTIGTKSDCGSQSAVACVRGGAGARAPARPACSCSGAFALTRTATSARFDVPARRYFIMFYVIIVFVFLNLCVAAASTRTGKRAE